MQHLDFTAAQAEAILKQAGELAVQRAKHAFDLGIVDPMTLKAGVGGEERCADLIDYMIRSDEGLSWGGREPYRYNGDAFQWCGAFAAYCMPYIALELRELYWASTDRLNAYLQNKLLFGNGNEKAVAAKYPKVDPKTFERTHGKPYTLAYSRLYGVFDEHSVTGPVQARAGDITLFGPARAKTEFRPFGQHVTVVDSWRVEASEGVHPARAWLSLYEGNATGEIPGRPETVKHPVQGVIHKDRPVGLVEGESPDDYHLRRWGRPSFFDIDLALFVQYGGILP